MSWRAMETVEAALPRPPPWKTPVGFPQLPPFPQRLRRRKDNATKTTNRTPRLSPMYPV